MHIFVRKEKIMKKTRFVIALLLLCSLLIFSACGSDTASEDKGSHSSAAGEVEGAGKDLADDAKDAADDAKRDVEDAAEDVRKGAEDAAEDAKNMGKDIADGVKDTAEDAKDAVTGDDRKGSAQESSGRADTPEHASEAER